MEAVLYVHPRTNSEAAEKQAANALVLPAWKMKINRRLSAGTCKGMLNCLCLVSVLSYKRDWNHLRCSPGSHGGRCNLWQPTIKLHQHRRPGRDFVIGQAGMG